MIAFNGDFASKYEAPLHFITISPILKHLKSFKYKEFGVLFYIMLDACIGLFLLYFLETVKHK